jgi:hypothetical protein
LQIETHSSIVGFGLQPSLVARTWRGWTPADRAAPYERFLQEHVLPVYADAEGNRGAYVLSRPSADGIEFMVLSLWDSGQSADAGLTLVSPRDDRYLVGRETIGGTWGAEAA